MSFDVCVVLWALEWGYRAWLGLLWDRRLVFLWISGRRAILLLWSSRGWMEGSIRRDASSSDIFRGHEIVLLCCILCSERKSGVLLV